jgi:hypothetical protein
VVNARYHHEVVRGLAEGEQYLAVIYPAPAVYGYIWRHLSGGNAMLVPSKGRLWVYDVRQVHEIATT